MQIHELDEFIGKPTADTLLAIDDGTETLKIPATEVGGVTDELTLAEAMLGTSTAPRVVTPAVIHDIAAVLVLDCGTISTSPTTITNENITADMVALKAELGTPSAQTGDWTVTTSAGSVKISGNISGSTTLKLYLINGR